MEKRTPITKTKELKHLNRGHSYWEKPIKAVVFLNQVALKLSSANT